MICWKVAYPTEVSARRASRNFRRKQGRPRPYFCTNCRRWHLTSHERR